MVQSRRFNRIPRAESLTDAVYEVIKEAILTLRIAPGDKLNVAEIAFELGTSSTPVREALNRLIKEGFVTKVPFKGLFVSEIDPISVQQLLEVRTILEMEAISRAAVRFGPQDLEVGARLIRKMLKAQNRGDIHVYIETSLDFHRLFINRCGNDIMANLLENLTDRIRQLAFLAVRNREIPVFLEDYERMLEALKARDPEGAKKALREHLGRVAESLYPVLERPGRR